MRKSRAKTRTYFRIEVTEVTTTSTGDTGSTSSRPVLIQEKDSINLPAILTAVNEL